MRRRKGRAGKTGTDLYAIDEHYELTARRKDVEFGTKTHSSCTTVLLRPQNDWKGGRTRMEVSTWLDRECIQAYCYTGYAYICQRLLPPIPALIHLFSSRARVQASSGERQSERRAGRAREQGKRESGLEESERAARGAGERRAKGVSGAARRRVEQVRRATMLRAIGQQGTASEQVENAVAGERRR